MKDAFIGILIFTTALFSMVLLISAGFMFAKTADNVSSGEVKEIGRVANSVEIQALGKYLDDQIIINMEVRLDDNLTSSQISAKYVYGDTVKRALLKNEDRIQFKITDYDGSNLEAIKANYVYAVKINGKYLTSIDTLENHKITEIEYEKIGIRKGSDL